MLLENTKEQVLIHTLTWMNLENIMLIERGQIGKHHNTASFLLYEESRIGKSVETDNRMLLLLF